MALTKKDLVLVGEEMTRALEPVYDDLQKLNQKVDALTVDVIELQNTTDVIHDQLVGIGEKLTEDRKDIKTIKKHIGLQVA